MIKVVKNNNYSMISISCEAFMLTFGQVQNFNIFCELCLTFRHLLAEVLVSDLLQPCPIFNLMLITNMTRGGLITRRGSLVGNTPFPMLNHPL